MRKTLITIFVLHLSYISLYSQVDTATFRDPINYSTAKSYYLKQYSLHPNACYFPYQSACYLALQGKVDSAFYLLQQAISKGVSAADVITDTDFNVLHENKNWATILDSLKQQFLRTNKGISHPEIAVELWLLGIEDQRYRTLSKNCKLKERPKETPEMWEKRIDFVKNITKTNGWPTITMVGEKAAESAFLIIQHANLNDIKKVLPLLIESANKGEAKWHHAAMMIDRYLSMTEGVQIYGTQFQSKGKKNKATSNIDWSAMSYCPIVDEENLDARRKSIGMKSFEEYCKSFKVEYKKPSERNDYKHIPIKHSWIKKGYIFRNDKQETVKF